MIRASRGVVSVPYDLTEQWQEAGKRLRAFYAGLPRSPHQRIQFRPEFEPLLWRRAESLLGVVFHDKCAYCDRPIAVAERVVDHFRPKGGAVNLSGEKSPEHYWWLTYEWRNLYLSCQECALAKGNKFPVSGQRTAIEAGWDEIEKEDNVLLDPCADDPESHLIFSKDGIVIASAERGEVTIEILNLNRPTLIEQRRTELNTARDQLLHTFVPAVLDEAGVKMVLGDMLSPSRPFAAARRQYIHRWLRENAKRWATDLPNERSQEVLDTARAASPFFPTKMVTDLTQRYRQAEQMVAMASPRAGRASRKFFFGRSQFITSIEIHNFKVIKDLKFTLDPTRDWKPWLVFLGENGTGKSSILKAVTLALMSEEQRRERRLQPSQFLRHRTRSGYVKVRLTGYPEPFELHFRRGEEAFESNNNKLHTLLFSYGGTRLLPRDGHKLADANGHPRVLNLFDPFQPLIDAKAWLLSLSDKSFEYSARAIRQLLQHEGEGELRRQRGKRAAVKLVFNSLGTSSTLEQLSDGYQSVVALAADILQMMLRYWDAAEDSEGIVLIDEIDAHLHPRWKIEIIELLRGVFPRVQFVVTTHDPLCLVGARAGEVYILRRDPRTRQIAVIQKDVPRGLTADQVLTGFWFGLSSTVDDETLLLLDAHRDLLRAGAPESDERRRDLEARLRARLGVFADTSLERMAQSVAAEIMQENIAETSRVIDPQLRMDIRQKILGLVRERQQKRG
jgi:uncharacterized protein (TIGR02646 family)